MPLDRVKWGLVIVAFLGVSGARAQTSPKESQPVAEMAPSFEERLNIQTVTDGLLIGGLPLGEDCATLAKEKGVTRIVSLRADQTQADAEAKAARAAGLAFENLPFQINLASGTAVLDRDALHAIVKTLKDRGKDVFYVYDKSGRGPVGVVDFAYQVWAEQESMATALRNALRRGFFAHLYPGIVDQFKLLVSGLTELPPITSVPITDRDLLGPGEFINAGGQRIHVKKFGQGPPIYVLHGGPGETHKLMRPYFDALKDQHTVVYYDQRGCGRSSKPQFAEAYSMSRMVQELDDLRLALGHDKIALVGHSTGAAIAMEYALAHPERVTHLVVLSGWASGQDVTSYAAMVLRLLSGSEMETYIKLRRRMAREQRSFNDEELTSLTKLAHPFSFFGRFDAAFRKDWNRRAEVSAFTNKVMSPEFFSDYDVRDRLAGLKDTSTLVVVGRYDMVAPVEIARDVAEHIPGARFEILDRSGHYLYAEENAKLIAMLREFLTPPVKAP